MNVDQNAQTGNETVIDIQTCSFLWLMENKKPAIEFILPKGSRFEIVAKFSIYVMDFFVKLVYPEHLKGYMKGSITLLNKGDQPIDVNESAGYFDDKNGILFQKKNWMLSHGEPYDTYRLLCEFAITIDQHTEFEAKSGLSSEPVALTTNDAHNLNPVITDFQLMYDDKKMTDVMLQSGGELFPAHKFVLAARSPVFCNVLSQQYFEDSNNILNVSDIDPNAVNYLLRFMYGKEMGELNYDIAKELLQAAHKYAIPSLKNILSKFLCTVLKNDTVCEILLLSDTVQDANLKSKSISHIKSNSKVVLNSASWKQLQESKSKLATEVLKEVREKNKSNS